MKKILISLVFLIMGLSGGYAAGMFTGGTKEAGEPDTHAEGAHADPLDSSYIKMHNQFIVPIVRDDVVRSMVILTLAVQADEHSAEEIALVEPKLQAAFLSALFDYSSIGGFTGNFTSPDWRKAIQNLLLTTAREEVSEKITDVLLLGINRQDY